MILIADERRRVVLPKPAKAGEAFECVETGDRIVLIRLQQPEHIKPAVSRQPLKPGLLKDINLDEPAFESIPDEGID